MPKFPTTVKEVSYPDPIKMTFTAKELAALHLAGALVLDTLKGEHRSFPQLGRAIGLIKETLEDHDCELTDEGWKTHHRRR